MMGEFDIWRLAAGLGLFLFGMHGLEQSLQQLAGRRFKRFLKQHTAQPARAVVAGAITTAALQSSSVVSLVVLAFVGTGLITLASATGIVYGSNLGTTATGWIVALVGFKLDIEALALPLVTLGGIGVVWSAKGTRRAGFSHLLVGLGLMLMGLEFMKSGAIAATEHFDPAALQGYPLIVFLAAGLVLTAIIQSSSATVMITLSALYASAISLESAAAIAIGADLGTTVTVLLGALAGSTDKKRVAAAIVIFNVVTNVITFIFLEPFLYVVTDVLGIDDPLYALVAFHSLFNFLGILLFLPWINWQSNWLARKFTDDEPALLRHLKPGIADVPEAAVDNVSKETLRLIDQAAALNQLGFELPRDHSFYDVGSDRDAVPVFSAGADYDACYADLKHLEGEILAYALTLQGHELDPEESARLSQLIPSIRNAVHSAKSIRDISADLQRFRDSINDRYHAYYQQFQEAVREFYESLDTLRSSELPALRFEGMVDIKSRGQSLHTRMHRRIYDEVERGELSRVDISTLLNVNREIYMSHLSLVSSLADALLDMDSADDFASIPSAT